MASTVRGKCCHHDHPPVQEYSRMVRCCRVYAGGRHRRAWRLSSYELETGGTISIPALYVSKHVLLIPIVMTSGFRPHAVRSELCMMTEHGPRGIEQSEREPLLRPPSIVASVHQDFVNHPRESQDIKTHNGNSIVKFGLGLLGLYLL